jgi:subtilisin family serine protease
MKTLARFITLVTFALTAVVAYAQNQTTSYLVVLNGKGPAMASFEKQVGKARGTVTTLVPEIGVAFVSSSEPGFKNTLERLRQVQSVAYNVPVPREFSRHVAFSPEPQNIPGGSDEFLAPLMWGLDAVNAPQAWAAGATGAGARVAVLDSGIDHDNLDLVSNINQDLSRSFLPCQEPAPGFGNCDGQFEDWKVREGVFFNHGTHVSGTIAAADNAFGGIGVAPDAEIVAVKVCTEFDTFCLDEAILPGIVYAAEIGADVINMSLGGLFDRNPSEICKFIREFDIPVPCGQVVAETQAIISAYRRAFQFAKAHGTTVIVSAGNAGLDADTSGSLGFAFADIPNVLGISALGPVGRALPAVFGDAPSAPLAGPDTLADYSNHGRSIIDFAAPGGSFQLADEQIARGQDPFASGCVAGGFLLPCVLFDTVLSNSAGDSFFFATGTSMAAPHASGVAAIIIGLNGGDMAPEQVRTAMKRYADDLGHPGHDKVFGDGRVNAGATVE